MEKKQKNKHPHFGLNTVFPASRFFFLYDQKQREVEDTNK